MAELKYRPNYIAQNLKTQKTHLIGLILPSYEGHYAQILKGITSILEIKGYFIITKITDNSIQKENESLDGLLNIGVCGMLIVPCEPENTQKYQDILDKGIPIVFLERKVHGYNFSNVSFDNKNIVYSITKQILKETQPDDVMIITGPTKYSSESECVEGFHEAMGESATEVGNFDRRIFEVLLQKEYAFIALYDYFVYHEKIPNYFIVSEYKVAQALYEVFSILNHEAKIYALSGDDWIYASKSKFPIYELNREAEKAGIKSAGFLLNFVKNKILVENSSITISNNYSASYDAIEIQPSPKKRKLSVLLFESNAMDALMKLSVGFSKQFNIEMVFNVLPYLELKNELVKQIQGKNLNYDIVMIDLPWIRSVEESGFLLDLKPMMDDAGTFLNSFPDGIKAAFFRRPRCIYGVPIIATIETLFYRKDIFENKDIQWNYYKKYGFDLRPPKNWTEFNCVAEYFNRSSNPNSPVQYGTSMCGLKPTGIVEEFLPRQWAFNGRIKDEWGKLCIDSDENVRALDSLLVTYKNSPKESLSWFFDDVFKKLLLGEIAMAQGFATHYMPYKYSQLENTFDRFISVDTIPGGKPMLGGWMLGINQYSAHHQESYSFLRWAASDRLAVQNTLMGGAIPVKAVSSNTLLKNQYPWLRYIDESFSNTGIRETVRDHKGNIVDPYLIDSILSDEIYKTLLGEVSAKQALTNAKESLQKIIAC